MWPLSTRGRGKALVAGHLKKHFCGFPYMVSHHFHMRVKSIIRYVKGICVDRQHKTIKNVFLRAQLVLTYKRLWACEHQLWLEFLSRSPNFWDQRSRFSTSRFIVYEYNLSQGLILTEPITFYWCRFAILTLWALKTLYLYTRHTLHI